MIFFLDPNLKHITTKIIIFNADWNTIFESKYLIVNIVKINQ